MLGEQQRPVVVKMRDGSTARGWIEYYDRRMVRLTREGEPNLFIYKHEIAYIAEDASPQRGNRASNVKSGNSTSAAQ